MITRVFLLVAIAACLAKAADADTTLSREGIERIKQSTVFIRLDAGPESATGSGFLITKDGESGFIITNSHVITLPTGVPGKTTVVFNSGQRNERELSAEVVANQPLRDLAVLKVRSADLPETIPSMDATELYETLPVYIAGFPFGDALAARVGNPAITISKGAVSSIRRDAADRIATIQIDGSINPGNSGGPIIGADGKLIGIAVAKVSGTQIGIAIPVGDLNALLLGEAGPLFVSRTGDSGSKISLSCLASVFDPMSLIDQMNVHVAAAPTTPLKPETDGRWTKMPAKEISSYRCNQVQGRRTVEIQVDQSQHRLALQISLTKQDGSVHWSMPTIFDLPNPGEGVLLYRGDATVLSRAPAPKTATNTPRPARSGHTGRERLPDLSDLLPFNPAAEEFVPSFCWSHDGSAAYTLSKNGSLKKYSVATRELMTETNLGGSCSDLKLSQEGLVAVIVSAQKIAVIDEQTLDVKGQFQVPGIQRVACSPDSAIGYVATTANRELKIHRLHFGRRKLIGTLTPDTSQATIRGSIYKPETLVVSPDGRHLFIEGGIEALIRMRIERDGIVVEEGTSRMISGRRAAIVVSSNSTLVAVPSGGGNSPDEHRPRLRYGTYVFRSSDLSIPVISIESGAYPSAIGFDIVAKQVYANSRDAPLIVFGAGGNRLRELRSGQSQTPDVHQILPHPSGFCAGVLTENHLFWADLSDPEE